MLDDIQKKYIKKESNYGAENYKPLPVVLSKAKGVWAWDVNNNKYLDMMSGYSAVSHGHAHPELIESFPRTICKTFSHIKGISYRSAWTISGNSFKNKWF